MADLNYVIGFDSELSGVENANRAINGLKNALGALSVGAGLSELIQLADSFNNLESKIRLATGGGQDFDTAMQGVKQIANDTYTGLEATGNLFGKITQSTKELNLSQQDVLGLTQTINQALKISGATAHETDSVILQFGQALQSGVLRGEEFNAIMENGGRFAKAMADGLGVTIGQMRKMAEAGELTSSVIMQAIQSQQQTINQEFGTMTVTVDNAMQQLKNSVLSMVGDIDNELNQSGGLANFIQSIAKGLDDINPQTIQALQSNLTNITDILETFRGVLSDVYQTSNNVMSSLAGVDDINENVGFLTRTLQGVSIVLGGIADMFKGLQATSNIAIGGITGQLATLYEKLGDFDLLPDKLQNYFKSLGEGLRKTSDESFKRFDDNVANFESSTKKALDSTIVTAENMAKQAEKAGQQAIAGFDKMAISAKVSSDELVKGFTEAIQKVATPEQFDALTTKLNQLATQGAISGEQLANALNLANEKSGELEAQFGRNIKSLQQLGFESQESTDITKQLAESAKTLGLNFEMASNKTTDNINQMTNSVVTLAGKYDELKNQGYDASALIVQGLDKMLASVKNQADIDMVRALFVKFGNDGKLSTEQVADGMEAINEKVSKTPALMDETAKAFKALGIISKEQALQNAQEQMAQFELVKKSGQASGEQLAQALQKVQKSIETSGDTAQNSWLKGQQSALGLNKELDNTAQKADRVAVSSSRIGDGVASGVRRGVAELDKLNQALDSTARRNQALTEQWEKDKAQREANNSNFLGAVNRNHSQYSTKTGVENFLKQAGLSDEKAMEETRKLFAQYGGSGKMNWAKANGFSEGMPMTTEDFKKYKSPSMYLLELAEKVRYSQKATASISIGNQSPSQTTDTAPNNADNSQIQAMQAQIASLQQQLQAKNQTATTLPKIDTSQNQALAKSLVDDLLKQAIAQGGQAMLQQLQDEIKRLPR